MKALITFALLGVLSLIIGTCSTEVIAPGNVGVRVRLGKVQSETVTEGLQFKNPITDSFKEVNVRQFTFNHTAECPSSDSQLVTTVYSIYARINPEQAPDVVNKYANGGVEDLFESLVSGVAKGGIKPIVVKYRAEEALAKRDEIRAELLLRLRRDVNHLFIIEDVQISDVTLSPELRAAIEAKQVREQQAIAVKYDLSKAQQEAEITIETAKAEAEAIRLKGLAIKENPNVVQLDIIKKWDGKSPTTVVVGSDDGGANILLPIKPSEQ